MPKSALRPKDLNSQWQNIQRIVIVGPSGSGKTTLAKALAQLLNAQAIDLDDLHWLPGWRSRDNQDFLERVAQAVEPETWVLSGNYQRTQHLSWSRADLIIFLDFSLALSLRRVIRRCIQRSLTREPVCNGNYESLRLTFLSKDSLLLWILKVHKAQRQRYRARFTDDSAPPILWLRHPAEVNQVLETVWLLKRPRQTI